MSAASTLNDHEPHRGAPSLSKLRPTPARFVFTTIEPAADRQAGVSFLRTPAAPLRGRPLRGRLVAPRAQLGPFPTVLSPAAIPERMMAKTYNRPISPGRSPWRQSIRSSTRPRVTPRPPARMVAPDWVGPKLPEITVLGSSADRGPDKSGHCRAPSERARHYNGQSHSRRPLSRPPCGGEWRLVTQLLGMGTLGQPAHVEHPRGGCCSRSQH